MIRKQVKIERNNTSYNTVNPYIPLYNQAHDVLHQGHTSVVCLWLAVPPGVDGRQYNLPTANEIAAILPGDNEHATSGQDLIVQLCLHNGDQNGPRYQHIWETNFNYTPLMYVLLFPHGEPGWGNRSTYIRDRKSTRLNSSH